MQQPHDLLVRRVTINGVAVPDSRLVVQGDGLAALIALTADGPTVISRMLNPVVEVRGDGAMFVTDGLNTWACQRENRCGSCAGRYTLSTVDAAGLIAAAFA